MAQNRGHIDRGGNDVQKQGPNDMLMDMKRRYAATPLDQAGNQTIPPEAILAGIIVRAGPVGAYADIFPAADSILAACPMLCAGDSFEFLFDNSGVAQANTPTGGAGITVVNGGVTASLVKRFLLTVIAAGRTNIQQAVTTNGQPTVSLVGANGFPTQSQASVNSKQVQVGMGVSGTGISGGTTVIAVNTTTGVITLSANATAGGSVALTFTPRIEIRGLYQAAA